MLRVWRGGLSWGTGASTVIEGLRIDAVPAYNIVQKRDNGQPYHPKGEGNGYILTFGDRRVYVAGDTEYIPEMKGFKNIDVAFLPMNMPNTMTPEAVVEAAKAFKPKILYPYHLRKSDTSKVVNSETRRRSKSASVRCSYKSKSFSPQSHGGHREGTLSFVPGKSRDKSNHVSHCRSGRIEKFMNQLRSCG